MTDWNELGLGSLLDSPDTAHWNGETAPPPYDLDRIRRAWRDLQAGREPNALGELESVREESLGAHSSYAMRWRFYRGLAHFRIAQHARDAGSRAPLASARDEFKRALAIGVSGNDVAAQITISWNLAKTQHDLLKYDLALSEYLTALGTLLRHKPGADRTRALAEIKLRTRIARQQFLLGQFSSALDNTRDARAIRKRIGGSVTTQWDRVGEEWIEALILRAEGHRCGGNIPMLRAALRLFKSAEKRLIGDEAHLSSLRRLYIQIAETHMDLAERYRSEGNMPSFNANMERAGKYAILASDALHSSDDSAGRALATLALLRHDHLNLKAYELASRIYSTQNGGAANDPDAHPLAPRIHDVEKMAVEMNDLVLIARAATLRADMMVSMHDYTAAMVVYYFAIATFERAGARGEAARAVYGVRRVLDIL